MGSGEPIRLDAFRQQVHLAENAGGSRDQPERMIAQAMNIGDCADVQLLASLIGDEALRDVLAQAEAGQFNERSWAYWYCRLDLASVDQVPSLPVRKLRLFKGESLANGARWWQQIVDPEKTKAGHARLSIWCIFRLVSG